MLVVSLNFYDWLSKIQGGPKDLSRSFLDFEYGEHYY